MVLLIPYQTPFQIRLDNNEPPDNAMVLSKAITKMTPKLKFETQFVVNIYHCHKIFDVCYKKPTS